MISLLNSNQHTPTHGAFGLMPDEMHLVQTSLQQIVSQQYIYIVIHAFKKDNKPKNAFKIFEFDDSTQDWVAKRITDKVLARWIADERAFDDKTIVLISGSNDKTTEGLAYYLGKYDAEAQRPTRSVIGWDEECVLFGNGHVTGGSHCRIFTPATEKGAQPTSKILSKTEIPQGKLDSSADVDSKFLLFAPLSVLEQRLRDTKKEHLDHSLRELKRKSKDIENVDEPIYGLYEKLVADKAAWDAWIYLKNVQQGSHATNDLSILKHTDAIRKRYFKENEVNRFQIAFEKFFITCPSGQMAILITQFLQDDKSLTVNDFEKLVIQFSAGKLLKL
jgi:hypothetical protein